MSRGVWQKKKDSLGGKEPFNSEAQPAGEQGGEDDNPKKEALYSGKIGKGAWL